jgi:hypothetical protein
VVTNCNENKQKTQNKQTKPQAIFLHGEVLIMQAIYVLQLSSGKRNRQNKTDRKNKTWPVSKSNTL